MTRALWDNYIRSGKSFLKLRDFEQAERMLAAALKVAEEWGPKDPRLGVSLNNLARARQGQGRYGEAEALFSRALMIAETERGPDHPDTAVTLSNLAMLYAVQDRHADAAPLYERALRIMESRMGRTHPAVATVLLNYASLLHKMNEHEKAEELEQRALEIRLEHGNEKSAP